MIKTRDAYWDNLKSILMLLTVFAHILFQMQNLFEIINFIVDRHTYFVDNTPIYEGMEVEIFYDTNVPVPLIYPPQYQAVVVAPVVPGQFVKVDWFNWVLVSRDRALKLNVDESTPIFLENGQPFRGSPGNRNLIVVYRNTTRSIPPQTSPEQIIVMC